MAGPSIKVAFLSDFSKLRAGLADVSTAAKGTGGQLKDAFGPALSALNKTGILGPFQDAFAGLGQSIETVKSHIKDVPLAMVAVGGTLATVGAGLEEFGSKDQAAHQQLQASIQATGKSYEAFAPQIEKAIKSQERFGTTANTTQDALRILTQATGSPTKALQELSTASDLAAAKHESLSAAATQMGKAYNGSARILKEYGIQVTSTKAATVALTSAQAGVARAATESQKAHQHLADVEAELAGKSHLTVSDQIRLRDAHAAVSKAALDSQTAHQKLITAQQKSKDAANANSKAMDELGQKLKGQAAAGADTFSGHLKALEARAEDSISTFAQKFGPAIKNAGLAMSGLGAAMKGAQGAMELAKTAALGTRIELMALSAWTKVQTAVQWLLNAAMDANPMVLVAIAIAAVIAVLVVVAVKTGILKDAWRDMQKAAEVVWRGILSTVKAVWTWIRGNWPLLVAILLGPFAIAAVEIARHWNTILAGAKAVWGWIRGTWHDIQGFLTAPFNAAVAAIKQAMNGLVSFFTGLPGRLGGIFSGMWGGLTSSFRGAINDIIDIWNKLHFPGINIGPFHTPSIGAPHIPHLAQGGVITQTGLVYAHAGEAISPIPASVRSGPVVHIDTVQLAETLDVELFARQLASSIKRAKV
jgi:phage-related protein